METQDLEHISRIIERLSERLDNTEQTRQSDRNAIWEFEAKVRQLECRIESLERTMGK